MERRMLRNGIYSDRINIFWEEDLFYILVYIVINRKWNIKLKKNISLMLGLDNVRLSKDFK